MRENSPTADLVSRANDGDTGAWHALVERFAPLIWSICRSYGLGHADAEDVGQNVWLQLVRHLGAVRDPDVLGSWLATTTRRECGRVRREVYAAPADGHLLADLAAEDAVSAEQELLRAERQAALREAVTRLPAGHQRLVGLLLADPPLPYAEISARLGLPVGSIGPSRRRCLDRLRQDPVIARLIEDG